MIYCFGIKGGIGADSLSAFFHLLHLEERLGCSASTLRKLEVHLEEQIVAYGKAQFRCVVLESHRLGFVWERMKPSLSLPILVVVELASGFI